MSSSIPWLLFLDRRRAIFVLAALCVGCGTAPKPRIDMGVDVARAAGVSDAIELRIDGEPLDEAVSPADPLTLPDAVGRAVQGDPQIQAALSRVRVAEAEADQSRLLPNPVLSVLFHAPRNGVAPPWEVAISEDLLSLLQRRGRIGAADHRLRQAAAEAMVAVLDVLAEVQSRYAAVQALDGQGLALQERAKLVDRLLETAQARLRRGKGTQLDVTTLQAQQIEVQSDLVERRLEARDQRLILSRLIGNPSGAARWRLSPWTPTAISTTPEDRWLLLAAEHRPEIQVRRWELAALGDDLALASLFPFTGASLGADAQHDRDWSAGPTLNVPLPLFDGGEARRAAAQARVIEARHQLAQARRQVVEDVRRAYAAMESAGEALELVQSKLLPLQEKRRRETEAAFLAGQTDATILVLVDQDL